MRCASPGYLLRSSASGFFKEREIKIRKPGKGRCGMQPAQAAGLCVLLCFTWLLLPPLLPSREKVPTLERSKGRRQLSSCLGSCRGFSPWAAPAGLCAGFRSKARYLQRANLAASQRHRQQFPRVSAAPRGTREEKPCWKTQWEVACVRGQVATSRPGTWPRRPGEDSGPRVPGLHQPCRVELHTEGQLGKRAFQENPWGRGINPRGRGMAGILEAGWQWGWCQEGSQHCWAALALASAHGHAHAPHGPGSGPAVGQRQL